MVWPALAPPWHLATMSYSCLDRTERRTVSRTVCGRGSGTESSGGSSGSEARGAAAHRSAPGFRFGWNLARDRSPGRGCRRASPPSSHWDRGPRRQSRGVPLGLVLLGSLSLGGGLGDDAAGDVRGWRRTASSAMTHDAARRRRRTRVRRRSSVLSFGAYGAY